MEDLLPLRRRDPVGLFIIGRSGLASVLPRGHAGLGGWSRRALALVAGVALALGVGAMTATSASAFQEHTECGMRIENDTAYTLLLYDSQVNGGNTTIPTSVPAGGVDDTFWADSWYPIHNHCSLNLRWELQTPDGKNWSQGLQTYVYDPNSGHNNAFASVTGTTSCGDSCPGDFGARTNVNWGPTDENSFEGLDVQVCGPTCPPPYSSRDPRTAFRSSPAGLRAGAAPLGHAAAAGARVHEPKQVRSLLRRGDLIGRGWKRATRVHDLGRLGSILAATKVPASCRDKAKESLPSPLKEGLSAFERRGGVEFIGAGQGIYANARQSRRTINDAVSTHSIGCMARALTSKRFHTSVSTERVSVTLAGRRLILNRLKISTHSGARITRTDYIDLIGVQHGKANALMIFASDKRHPDARSEAAAISTVVRRLP